MASIAKTIDVCPLVLIVARYAAVTRSAKPTRGSADRGPAAGIPGHCTDCGARRGTEQSAGRGALRGFRSGTAGLPREHFAFGQILLQPIGIGIVIGVDYRLPPGVGRTATQSQYGANKYR